MERLHHTVPLGRIVAVTFTFSKGTTDAEACAEFSAINRQFLRVFPGGYVRVLAFTKAGAPHLHVVAITGEDIRSNFYFVNYAKMRELSDLPTLTDEQKAERVNLGQSLNPNPALRLIWNGLREIVDRRRKEKKNSHTFAVRIEATPVIKNAAALGEYLGRDAKDTLERPTAPTFWGSGRFQLLSGGLSKGVRPITYGGDFPKAMVYTRSKGQKHWKAKISNILAALEMPHCYMKERFRHPKLPKRKDANGKPLKQRRRGNWHTYLRNHAIPVIEQTYSEDFTKWPKSAVREIAYSCLQHIDQWKITGVLPEYIKALKVPTFRELGFVSHTDMILSQISLSPPEVSMPAPIEKPRRRSASKTPPLSP